MNSEIPGSARPLRLPKLALWMFQRGLKLKDGPAAFGVSPEALRRYTLPFGDQERRVPPIETIALIKDRTAGDVTAEDFYPPELLRAPESAEAAA